MRRSRLRDFGGVAAAAVWRKRRDSCADVFPYSVAKPECGMLVIGTGTAHGRLRKALFYVDKIEVGGQSNRFPPSHSSCGTLEPSSTVSTSLFPCLSSLRCYRNLALPAAVFSSCITICSSFRDGTLSLVPFHVLIAHHFCLHHYRRLDRLATFSFTVLFE